MRHGVAVETVRPLATAPHLRNRGYLRTKERPARPRPRPPAMAVAELPTAPRSTRARCSATSRARDRPAVRGAEVRPDPRRPDRHVDRRREVDQRRGRAAGLARAARGVRRRAGRASARCSQDDPQLTVRMVAGASPLRGRARLDAAHSADGEGAVRRRRHGDPVRAGRRSGPAAAAVGSGATVREVPPGPDGLRIDDALRLLRGLGVESLLVEGGGRVITSMLRAGRPTGSSCRSRPRSSVRGSRRSDRSA